MRASNRIMLHIIWVAFMVASTSAEGQKFGMYQETNALDGRSLCGNSTPAIKVQVASELDCYRRCMSQGCSCATGANYRAQKKLCEMYSMTPPVVYETVLDCRFFNMAQVQQPLLQCIQSPLLIQQHVDGYNFFARTWEEFRAGFGSPGGNFWLGNSKLHHLTKDGQCQLRIDIQQASTTNWLWAAYSNFIVADERSGYQLTVGGFSGDVTFDSMSFINGEQFHTFDRDGTLASCAFTYGGFWYHDTLCTHAKVNGPGTNFHWQFLAGGWDLLQSSMSIICS